MFLPTHVVCHLHGPHLRRQAGTEPSRTVDVWQIAVSHLSSHLLRPRRLLHQLICSCRCPCHLSFFIALSCSSRCPVSVLHNCRNVSNGSPQVRNANLNISPIEPWEKTSHRYSLDIRSTIVPRDMISNSPPTKMSKNEYYVVEVKRFFWFFSVMEARGKNHQWHSLYN